jgi:hypothetical protein
MSVGSLEEIIDEKYALPYHASMSCVPDPASSSPEGHIIWLALSLVSQAVLVELYFSLCLPYSLAEAVPRGRAG